MAQIKKRVEGPGWYTLTVYKRQGRARQVDADTDVGTYTILVFDGNKSFRLDIAADILSKIGQMTTYAVLRYHGIESRW